MQTSDYPGPERRRFRRINKQFAVRLRVLSEGPEAVWDLVLIRNISREGLLFDHDREIREGASLQLKINAAYNKLPVECVGKAIRVTHIREAHRYQIAVFFTQIGLEAGQTLGRAIDDFVAKESKEKKR